MLQNDSHLNCLCVMARLIEALAIYIYTPSLQASHSEGEYDGMVWTSFGIVRIFIGVRQSQIGFIKDHGDFAESI